MDDLVEQLRKLDELHRNGALSDTEFAAAKNRLLSDSARPTSSNDAALQEIVRQNNLAQLEREWARERERYMITGRHGRVSTPSAGGGIAVIVIAVLFGGFWMITASSITSPSASPGFPDFPGSPSPPGASLFPLFGLLFIGIGIWIGLSMISKASALEDAESKFEKRRADLLNKSPDEPPSPFDS